MPISLLPDELRKREEEEKEKVKGAMGLPKFKMHAAENGANGKPAPSLSGQSSGPAVSFDDPALAPQDKGAFRVVPKNAPPRIPNIPQAAPKIVLPEKRFVENGRTVTGVRTVNPPPAISAFREKINPLPKIPNRPPAAGSEHAWRMRVPEAEKESNGPNKKVFREAHDKIDDLKKPPPLLAALKQDIPKDFGKSAPTDVNLISEDYPAIVRAQFWRRMKQLVTVVLVFVALGGAGYVYIKEQKLTLLQQYQKIMVEIDRTDGEIDSFSVEGKQFEALKDRAAALQILLDNHIYWTAFLGQLEKVTLENVRYYNLVAETNGDILLSARAKKYEDAAIQLAALAKAEFVDTAEISSLTQTPEVKDAPAGAGEQLRPVAFGIKLKLKPDFLNKK